MLMQDNQLSTAVTLSATIEAIRRYPDNQILIHDIVTSQSNSEARYQQQWMESHTPQLLRLAKNVENEISEQITRAVVSNMESLPVCHNINQIE